ncbi:MAG TPA: hypothetical protein VFR94_09615 [Nitrososphaeraceae archaeon]|nr:hypothetical protein [Nitrososphaeraceae archaeon]
MGSKVTPAIREQALTLWLQAYSRDNQTEAAHRKSQPRGRADRITPKESLHPLLQKRSGTGEVH